MNLMFWKKKTGAGEEVKNEPGTPAKPGLAARLKLQIAALAMHFKKAPAFHADEEQASDVPGGSKKPDGAAAIKPDLESPDTEAPAKPGLAVRIKLQLITLIQRFRKTPAPDDAEEHADEADESPEPEAYAKPGLFMRIKAGFAAFSREIKGSAPATDEGEDADSHGRSRNLPDEGELPVSETAAAPARPRKWLVVGGSIFIVVLLLVDIAFNFWLSYEPRQKRWGTRHDITSISSRPSESESMPENSRNEVEALQLKNAELQARIKALKGEPPQQRPNAQPAWQPGGESTPLSSVNGELMVGNKDAQATAMTLKEAIEAMNADSGDHAKKPAK